MSDADSQRRPLVAFIIATLDASARLQQCLDSIVAQTDRDWEIIVIDGGSRDGTPALLRRNADIVTFWSSEPDRGIYDAWNKGLAQVTARWVNFLGADDHLFDARAIERMRRTLDAVAPAARIVYGRVAGISEAGDFVEYFGAPWEALAKRFRREMCVPHQGVFHRRELFDNGARFDASFRFAGDYEFLLREVTRRAPVYCDDCVAAWRDGGRSSEAGDSLAVLREFRRARQLNGIAGSTPLLSLARALAKQLVCASLSRERSRALIDALRVLTRRRPKYRVRRPVARYLDAS